MDGDQVTGSHIDRGTASRRSVLRMGAVLGATLASCGRWSGRVGEITPEAIREAEALLGLEFTDEERSLMLEDLVDLQTAYRKIREIAIGNQVPPALRFDPLPPAVPRPPAESGSPWRPAEPRRLTSIEELAFAPVSELAPLLESRAVSSTALTRLCLDRIGRFDETLLSVITLTPELALEQAERADREIAAGRYRGPLHGVPWGAKDLLSVRNHPTTWGAEPYREQTLDEDATVVERLEASGAVLVAKLSLGALAWGDVWFGGKTRSPWNPEQGSSGSSAGPAAAVAAGLVPFAIGSETWGSIVSPATRCGVTGLRPTFGRVSRHGAMALSWSMDKLGPMARTATDCALVLEAISGRDGLDPSVQGEPFRWDAELDPRRVRLGWVPDLFEAEEPEPGDEGEDEEAAARAAEWRRIDEESLDVLRGLGFELVPIELPKTPVEPLALILDVEAAAAFDELTRSGRDDLMVRQERFAWPNVFRKSRLVPAVEYVQANRARTLLLREMESIFADVDVYVSPTYGGDNLLLTNLTGHPSLVLPNGFRDGGTPTSLSFTGRLYGESQLVALGRAFQEATGFHRRRPELRPSLAEPPAHPA